ncbi:DEAD/DEAH box helicase [candidate division KSB3 bacterium]|nr:DEAD/DEAH box helicase [candidate division KSB3 bacterium]
MGLKDIKLKPVYYSDENDILEEFYIPALSNSSKYDRIAGYFSSNSLAIAAKGIAPFIKAGGRIRLIANVVLSEKDQEAIKKALLEKEREVITEIENLEDKLKKDHIRMLGWMVNNNLLEIKIAVVKNGVEHQKIGVLEDSEGKKISFSGSDNETVQGWLFNDEQFHVFCSWKEGDSEHLVPDIDRFNCLWDDSGRIVRVYEVSDAFKMNLIKNAPRDALEFEKLSVKITNELLQKNAERYRDNEISRKIAMREYQKDAIDKWIDNGYRCIFEMATGSGKTFTALGCLEHLIINKNNVIAVIVCPYNHMITQWRSNIREYGIEIANSIADSSKPKWKDDLADNIRDVNNEVMNNLIVLTTHDTFYRDDFLEIVGMAKTNLFLIGDEVHGMWSEKRKNGLVNNYKFRLGLSATPSRWFDSEGTQELFGYFNVEDEDQRFVFSLEEAIKTVNPETGETYLAPYEYKPYFGELNEEELEEYEEKTKDIVKAYHRTKNNAEKQKYFVLLCKQREDVIRNAISKYEIFKEMIDGTEALGYCLIYCSPEQINRVQTILNERNIIQHKFTQNESIRPDKKYGGISERDYLLEKFSDGTYQALVAIRCLDEGVDIPQARMGIILASTGNPRQYIQRRGRLLRRYHKKDKAVIYDVLILPPPKSNLPTSLVELEKKILRKEFLRYQEFAYISTNVVECIRKIREVEDKYDL